MSKKELKERNSKWEKKVLIPTSNFCKYVQGAGAKRAKICHFWHFLHMGVSTSTQGDFEPSSPI